MTEGEFLKNKYWGDEKFREVVKRSSKREKGKIPPKPEEQINLYLKRLYKGLTGKELEKEKIEKGLPERFKRFLLYKIRKEYFFDPGSLSEERLQEIFKEIIIGNYAESKGYTLEQLRNSAIKEAVIKQWEQETDKNFQKYKLPQEEIEQLTQQILKDQEESLKEWFDYLLSPEAENYPLEFRYWAFVEMLKCGSYDEERKKFNERTKSTIAPFPSLNQQALAIVLDEIIRKQEKQEQQEQQESSVILASLQDKERREEFEKRLKSENFRTLYGFALDYVKSLVLPKERLPIIQGEWKKFKKGSDPSELVEAIKNFSTGWCIAGIGTAANYLQHSDVYIYFSYDKNNNPTIPRAAIVYNHKLGRITEIRGIAEGQNLDPYIHPVVEEKLKSGEIPGGEDYLETIEDQKKLAEIYIKHLNNQELTKEDLRFIYEIDREIKGFGYNKDPRIEEILRQRDIKKDLVYIFNTTEDRISLTREEALKGDIIFHYGNLNLSSLKSAEGLKLPKKIGGYLDLSSLESAEGLKLPKKIGGSLYLSSLKSVEELELPEEIGGNLDLRSLESVKRLKFPKKIGGSLILSSLKSVEELELPEEIGGGLNLSSLESVKRLKLPKKIRGYLNLSSLKSAEELELPEEIGGGLNLSSLESVERLKLPKKIGGGLYLSSLKSAEELELPEEVGGYLDLRSLESVKRLKFPKKIGGSLNLSSLKSVEELELPEEVGGYLDLRSLESVERLKFPKKIGGHLVLFSLKSAEELELPEEIGGDLNLRSLESAKRFKLPKKIGGHLVLFSLKSAEGLELPKEIGGFVYLNSLSEEERERLKKEYPNLRIRP